MPEHFQNKKEASTYLECTIFGETIQTYWKGTVICENVEVFINNVPLLSYWKNKY